MMLVGVFSPQPVSQLSTIINNYREIELGNSHIEDVKKRRSNEWKRQEQKKFGANTACQVFSEVERSSFAVFGEDGVMFLTFRGRLSIW